MNPSPSAKNCVMPTPESGIPHRDSMVAITCRLITPSSTSGRLRWLRTPRFTWAMEPSPSLS
ncbi:Uncharacterised protein [Mycobacteroides abscessus subsp. abscessus]|nr:Uncharacterised protein [Mycobacteroides abscessus subsp. abscessus]